jgi:proton glutamate symport protein
MKKGPWIVFAAIICATIVGSLTGTTAHLFGITYYSIFDTIGSLFIRALTFVVIPLVAASIISGIAKIGGDKGFGRLGVKMFSFYLGTTLIAILTGLLFVNLFNPGAGEAQLLHQKLDLGSLEGHVTGEKSIHFGHILHQIIPTNIVEIFTSGHMLSLICFSLVFGYVISQISSHPASILKGFWQGVFEAMIKLTQLLMKFLPIGVFCLVAKTFATTGFEALKPLLFFFLAVVLGLLTFVLVALPLLLKFVAKVNPWLHFRAMGPALITAFSTSSSSATLPITIDCVEKRAGVSNRICSLVVPLGTSINMSGSALYECVAALFVAQCYGLDLSFGTQIFVVLLSLIASLGVAGIPSASLVGVILILKTLGLPAEGIGLFLAVDRILDMCRTTVNVFSDSCCAVLVACTEGETHVLTRKDLNYD